jgi:hypothetical protein
MGEILRQVQTDDPPSPRQLNPRVHPDLETICLKAMAREPGQRYPSALALAADLERFAASEPIQARRTGPIARLVRCVRRHPVGLASALAGLLAIMAATLVFAFARELQERHRLDLLRSAFDQGLEQPEATAEYFERMEDHLAGLQALAPNQVPELRERMIQRVAGALKSILERPRLTPEAEEHLRSGLKILAVHAPLQAEELQHSVDMRRSDWLPLFTLESPFAERKAILVEETETRGGGLWRLAPVGSETGPHVRISRECRGPVRLEAVFDSSWAKAASLGLVLNQVEGPPDEVLHLVISPDGSDRGRCQRLPGSCGHSPL